MTGGTTWEQLAAAIVFFFTVMGALAGVWWRIEGKVEQAKSEAVMKATEAATEAASVRADLAAHKLHVAENYPTKAGIKELRDEILGAIIGIKDDLRHLSSRIDNMHGK
jgi:Na+(H+)/acetate symporter ActP